MRVVLHPRGAGRLWRVAWRTAPWAVLALEAVGVAADGLIAVRWLLVLGIATGAFAVAYRYGPSREPARWRWLWPGRRLPRCYGSAVQPGSRST